LRLRVSDAEKDTIVASRNGFISTVLAWEQHLHLQLRPDDVWLAILLVKFSFFVNGPGRAEALRDRFIVHEGK
ncbi:uncharacterized protein CCOS01_04367, partial [Colletotrichum costaricense]